MKLLPALLTLLFAILWLVLVFTSPYPNPKACGYDGLQCSEPLLR